MSVLEWTDGAGAPDGISTAELPGWAGEGEMMDARVCLCDEAGDVVAWAALWWRETPELDGRRVGAVGGFGARDGAAAVTLLEAAVERLQGLGLTRVVGPMNGNTWRSYRHVVSSTGRGAFLMEPRNPPEWPHWWEAAGFEKLAGYSSSAIMLDGEPTVSDAVARRLAASGVVIRDLEMDRYDEELAAIHQVTLAGFANNFLYTPLAREPFVAAYRKFRDRVDPRLVRIAERDGKACGYVFGIADLEAAGRGEVPAMIVKTLTVDPAARCAGLGSVLVDEVQRRGFEAGFREGIHALQHDGNPVLRITSRHGGARFRSYALFGKRL